MRLLWITAAIAFVLDQGSKLWVFQGLGLARYDQIDVLAPYLVLRPGLNTGINFGLFADGAAHSRWILIAVALGICALLLYWARTSFHKRIEYLAAGCVIGGALGNVLDRLIHPGVLDFLNMSCCGINNPYVFNLADVFIFAGAFGLALFTGSSPKRPKAKRTGGHTGTARKKAP